MQKRCEVLAGLPGYGPMYVPVSEDGKGYYSEGYVVRFYKSDGSSWVANFEPGGSDFNLVIDYPDKNIIVVIACGLGYIMTPEQEKPLATFGFSIKNAFVFKINKLILVDDLSVSILEDGLMIWQSERISWDGIKGIVIEDTVLSGLSYDPMDEKEEWKPFSVDLETKTITGGSYRLGW